MLNHLKYVPILKLCQHNWDKSICGAYGKAGNGNEMEMKWKLEMETGNGNWKWKYKQKHQSLVQCFFIVSLVTTLVLGHL